MVSETVIYAVVGLLMVVIGLYIVWQSFQRQKNNKNNFSELTASGKRPVVARDQRDAFLSERTNSQPNDTDALAARTSGSSADDLSSVSPLASRGAPAASSGSLSEVSSAPVQSSLTAKSGVDTLGDTLSSLEHATAEIMPDVQTGEVSDFEGSSSVLDSHLKAAEEKDRESALQSAEEVISLTLLPSQVLNFDGEAVLEVLSAHGLKFGEMNLFHRFEEADGTGDHMFSVMRHSEREGAVPFDLQTLSDETVDGLTFFLPLPHPRATASLSAMLSLSGGIARDLNARVFDENFEVFDRKKRDDMAQYVHEYAKSQPI